VICPYLALLTSSERRPVPRLSGTWEAHVGEPSKIPFPYIMDDSESEMATVDM